MEAIRFLADLSKNTNENTYPGWPLSLNVLDNDGRRAIGFLPMIITSKPNQLIKIYHQSSGKLVSAMRISGNTVKPSVFENDTYRISIGEGLEQKTVRDLKISMSPEKEIRL